jgi:hypothetical protein
VTFHNVKIGNAVGLTGARVSSSSKLIIRMMAEYLDDGHAFPLIDQKKPRSIQISTILWILSFALFEGTFKLETLIKSSWVIFSRLFVVENRSIDGCIRRYFISFRRFQRR